MSWIIFLLGALFFPILLFTIAAICYIVEKICVQFKTDWQKEAEYYKSLYDKASADNHELRTRLNPPTYKD